ncbi:MAG: beta-carotene 15,15'-dioxygenase, Brp/Blh family [Phycisphaera sp.]|nr:beta-carotene 15,15'-dioxygenase, Brp/Blh family [Phycisphaera sp.]
MSPIALQSDARLRDGYDPPADEIHPPAGSIAPVRHELVVRGLPWFALLATAILGFVAHDFTRTWDTVPFILSFVFFGMPHGAMDWVVNQRMRRAAGLRTGLPGFAWYLGWMAVSAIALVLAPVPTVLAFFVLTVVHWGLGDLEATTDRPLTTFDRASAISGRGLLILGSAFAFDPAAAWNPFAMLVGDASMTATDIQVARLAGVLALAIGSIATMIRAGKAWSAGNGFSILPDLGESLLIVLAIGLANPLFGIGVYFLFAHSYRHSLRLASTPEALSSDPKGSSLARRLVLVHLLSIPLLLPTLVILLAWCRIQFGNLDPASLTVTMIGFFIVTTLPHHMLGRRLPRQATA